MPLNGTGTYNPPSPGYPAVAGEFILAADFNTIISDMSAALSFSIFKDGQQTAIANLPMGGFKHTSWGGFTGGAVIGTVTSYALTATGAITLTGALTDLSGSTEVRLPSDTTGTTQALGDNTTKVATTGFVKAAGDLKANIESPTFTGTVTIPGGASIAGFAPLASPTFTGIPEAPTAAPGTNTTQIATMEALLAQAFDANLPAQAGNEGKYITTDGTTASWTGGAGTGITASTTQTQAGATALTKQYNVVTTVANSGDAVKLIAAAAAQSQTIRNEGANSLQVFPASGDSINGGAVDAADPDVIPAGEQRTYFAADGTNWYRAPAAAPIYAVIETRTIAAATGTEDITDLSGYDDIIIVYDNVLPTTDGGGLKFRVSDDNGATWITSGYSVARTGQAATSFGNDGGSATADFNIGNVAANEEGLSGETIFRHMNLGKFLQAQSYVTYITSSGANAMEGVSVAQNTTVGPFDAIQIFMNADTLAGGTLTVIGVKR